MSKRVSEPAPWYAPPRKRESRFMDIVKRVLQFVFVDSTSYFRWINLFSGLFFAVMCAVAAGVAAASVFLMPMPLLTQIPLAAGAMLLAIISAFLILHLQGVAVQRSLPDQEGPALQTGLRALRGILAKERARSVIPAPELALQQLIQQVRNYAQEKSFQQNRGAAATEVIPGASSSDIIRRRWNEVVDSVNEFEIFLASDSHSIIEKLIAKSPPQNMDVSRIFRDVAESFDISWRRKGINIESAIVTPLRAMTHENLLRRLLVGPWRSSVYFARRGNGVVFSARSIEGQVIAFWECDGLAIPDDYLQRLQDSTLSVSQRIEEGLAVLAPDPSSSPNTFHALVSFITWVDLAQTCEADYTLKNTTDGFVIELRLS